ncbi:hypothetical protein MPSEU_000256400 [Mayamaea pseudoterrestris]|nr:hypothetical protein MPSEU_000256400 [Mayamaea pseudoterrestris]
MTRIRNGCHFGLFAVFLFTYLTGFCLCIRTRLTWINGIGHTLQHMKEGQASISARFCGKKVEWCHNPTAMSHDEDWRGYLGDLTQATSQKFGKITIEVETLTQHLRQAIQKVGRRGVVVHIAHSQGALITALACRQLTLEEMSRMEVLCFGGAACLQRTVATPFRRCMNYYSINDPLLLLNPEALQALRSGFVEQQEFCFLSPRLGDPILDHALLNPTYAQALEWEGARFERMYVPIVYRVWRRLWLAILLVRATVEPRIIAALQSLMRPVLRWVATQAYAIHNRVVKPVMVVLLLFIEWIARLLFGEREKFVPAREFLSEAMAK